MEDHCWQVKLTHDSYLKQTDLQDIILDADPNRVQGGKSDGLGSFFNYHVHCLEEDHKKGRDSRISNLVSVFASRMGLMFITGSKVGQSRQASNFRISTSNQDRFSQQRCCLIEQAYSQKRAVASRASVFIVFPIIIWLSFRRSSND